MKSLREIVGKPLKITVPMSSEFSDQRKDEEEFVGHLTKGATQYDLPWKETDYTAGIAAHKEEKPDVGLKEPLKKLKEEAELELFDVIDEAIETLGDDEFEVFMEDLESLDEISRDTLKRYIQRTKDNPKRKDGRNLALKKNWGDEKYGLPEPKVKASVKEDAEQVDEISKKTLGSYTKKARDDYSERERAIGVSGGITTDSDGHLSLSGSKKAAQRVIRKQKNRLAGHDRAIDKLTKEDVNENHVARYDPMSGHDREEILNYADEGGHHIHSERDENGHVVIHHKSGFGKAALKSHLRDRGVKFDVVESIEPIQELDKKTLKSYIKKATTSRDRHDRKADQEEDKAMSTDGNKYPEKQARHTATASKHYLKYFNRNRGIEKATDRLKK